MICWETANKTKIPECMVSPSVCFYSHWAHKIFMLCPGYKQLLIVHSAFEQMFIFSACTHPGTLSAQFWDDLWNTCFIKQCAAAGYKDACSQVLKIPWWRQVTRRTVHFFFLNLIYLKSGETERERKGQIDRCLTSTGSLPRYPQQLGWARNSIWFSHMGSSDPSIWTVNCCFAGCISRELDLQWSNWSLNCHTDMGCWHWRDVV